MARVQRGTTPADQELFRIGTDAIWQVALELMAEEAEHTLTCVNPGCAGPIFTWLNKHLSSRREAIVFCAAILERLSDDTAGSFAIAATADESAPGVHDHKEAT